MKRSMYSLILSDDIVAAVDALAAQKGTSRSNYINQVLAKHVQCITPEQQMQRVFANLTHQMDEAFRIQEQGSNALLSILGSVQYKYRPTIRYRVELLRNMQQEEVGRLKISCRTQNQTLFPVLGKAGTEIRCEQCMCTGIVSDRIGLHDHGAAAKRCSNR